jgi:hypothetical protein
MRRLILLLILITPMVLAAQTNNYWSSNFNEESSLLSGAVVGGDAGPSAIYYNPASISEIEESKLSLNASLFSFEIVNAKNAWGDGIDAYNSRFYVIPRFLSYMFKPKKHPKWSMEIAFLNNGNVFVDNVNYVDENINILTNTPGVERYNAYSQYVNKLRDDWFGIGGSYKLNDRFSIGGSVFVSILSQYYYYLLDIDAGPNNEYDDEIPYFTAKYFEQDVIKYNDYRLLGKLGFLYKSEKFSVGLNLTSPSLSGLYSDGKRLMRKRSQSNITNAETGEPIPNYLVTDFKEKKEVTVNSKSPFSIAAGLTYYKPDKTKVLYLTAEYFVGIDAYKTIQANESPDLAAGTIFEDLNNSDWLTYIDGAKPILNAAIGYRWIIREDLMFLTGFRTDFNYKKNFDNYPIVSGKTIKNFNINRYHFTNGLSLRVLGQDLIAGFQYTLGRESGQKQFVNLADPVEFNYEEKKALQGTRNNSVNVILNSVSIYFGATFNFNGHKK